MLAEPTSSHHGKRCHNPLWRRRASTPARGGCVAGAHVTACPSKRQKGELVEFTGDTGNVVLMRVWWR